jgi:protoporphyrinogen/coproporphyrinogen III oxidase
MPTPVDVVVIGGGLSGLAVAHGAQNRGAAVEVLEAAARAGGVIGSLRSDGVLYETGPNSALDTTPQIDELLVTLGLGAERIEVNAAAATRFIVRDGRLVPLPLSPQAFLLAPAFSLVAKLRVLREPFIAPAPPEADESVAAFVRRRLGQEILDYAADPFVSGVYAGDPEELSVAAAFPRLRALEQEHGSLIRGQIKAARARRQGSVDAKHVAGSFSFRDGMQTLTNALARAVGRVTTGVRVQRIDRDTDGLWTVSGTRDGESVVRRAHAVVLAVPSFEAAALLRELSPAAADGLAGIAYAPIASVASAYRRDDIANPLAGFGFLVPRVERRSILGSLFSTSMFMGRAPPEIEVLTSFVGGRRAPDLPGMADAELEALVHGELAALVGARNAPLWTAITRWKHAIPQYTLGHQDRLRRVDEAERALPGLFFCASYRGGISVGDRIKSADAATDSITRFLEARAS